jgi:hypothetical protein
MGGVHYRVSTFTLLWEAPMTKSQIPMKSQYPMTNQGASSLEIELWDLIGIWDLGFGNWDFTPNLHP